MRQSAAYAALTALPVRIRLGPPRRHGAPFDLKGLFPGRRRGARPAGGLRAAQGNHPIHCRHAAARKDTGSRRSAVPPLRCRATYRPGRVPGQHGHRREQPTPTMPASSRPHLPPQESCRTACAARPKVLCSGDLGPWRALPSRGGLTMTEDPRQTRRNGSDPRTAQSRSARSGGGSSRHVPPGLPCAPADVECERRAGRRALCTLSASARAERPDMCASRRLPIASCDRTDRRLLRGHVKAQVTLRERRSPLTRQERPVLRAGVHSCRVCTRPDRRLAPCSPWRHCSQPCPRQKSASSRARCTVTYKESAWVLAPSRVVAGGRIQIKELRTVGSRSRRDATVFYGPVQMHRIADKYAEILSCCAPRPTRVTD